MPAGPEVAIMTKFFNEQSNDIEIINIEENNPKITCDISVLKNKHWKIRFESRNREFLIHFLNDNLTTAHMLGIYFGKLGNFHVCAADDLPDNFKNSLIRLYTSNNKIFYLTDISKIAGWNIDKGFSKRFNPDILFDFDNWLDYLYEHRHSHYFNKPVFEVMSVTKFFNGISDFSKSEILFRTRASPFMRFKDLLKDAELRDNFFDTVKKCLLEIYNRGGLQHRFWKNPYGISNELMSSWSLCYRKTNTSYFHIDEKQRKFWFNKFYVTDYMLWINENGIPYMNLHDIRLVKMVYPTLDDEKD